ncbi:uncharacterized protein LOC131215800 [Anopheles bellator]|uniref:uncharacterized protein LOC131215800 n=1 Tax=Anopheles bellator TaxID=139047 RepID=UPI002647DDE8|nr:uncharacterized protein LOC131215800 [Anopheles bellator]
MDMLRGDRHCMLKMKEELDMLKPRLESYAMIQQALNATVQEVDKMLASDTSRATVIALAATLKRELQAQEIKRKEQSDRLQRLQNELMEERRKRKALEENLSSCDSEIYRLEQQVKQLSGKGEHHNVSVESASPEASVIANTPDQQPPVRRKRPMVEEDLNTSTPLSEKTFEQPVTSLPNPSPRRHQSFLCSPIKDQPENKPRFMLTSSTVTARLKTGKLKRHPSTILNGEKLAGENALDRIADLDIVDIVGK